MAANVRLAQLDEKLTETLRVNGHLQAERDRAAATAHLLAQENERLHATLSSQLN